ncbi:MAG: NAD-dependent epimerase/dehydratase family protein [Actinomycetota bacterium]|nr:NAD-dependent epimerase/dehydratase family protein [Actinomycetota bacterium]
MALDILVLGGTSWLGGTVAREALRRGHRVTCLARGESGQAPGGVTWVRADRWSEDAFDAVLDKDWDSVVDVGRQPVMVRSALAALADRTRHWIFVSTCSVYADDSTPRQDESAPLHEPWSGEGVAADEDYGSAKVACELACRDAVPADRLLVARSGLIAGHGDRSDRFGYWPARLDRAHDGQPVLTHSRGAAVQVIDVLDLAAWLVTGTEATAAGTYNVLGDVVTLDDVLSACARKTGSEPTYSSVDQTWLTRQGVAEWSGPGSLPLWLPMPDYAGHMTRSNAAARRSGLTLRPLSDTVASALAWERELGLTRERRAGLSPAREAELIALST